MKVPLLFILSLVLVASCQKSIDSKRLYSEYLSNVEKGLKGSLSTTDFANLDFQRAIITMPGNSFNYLRVPFRGITISKEFVLLKTDPDGKVLDGFIINLKKKAVNEGKSLTYNGVIKISSLSRNSIQTSGIIKGYIVIFHSLTTAQTSRVVPTDKTSPDIVESWGGGTSVQDWIRLNGFFGDESDGWYSSLDDGDRSTGGGTAASGGASSDGTINFEERIRVDFEPVEDLSPIDVSRYVKCFSNIPDAGSLCSIEIFSDIPIDTDPNKLFDWQNGSPGHTFLQFKKVNGYQTVVQNIGFYPVQGWKSILANTPVKSKFIDNGGHEFNASFKMNVTPEQFNSSIKHMVDLSKSVKYDIDDYNCTDLALDVFNYSRTGNPIVIPKYYIPGSINISGSSTPQGLYNKLKSMKQGGIEQSNIEIPAVKEWVPGSSGACN